MFNMLFTAAFTILGGVFVFSLSQLILKFLIEPIHEQRKAIGEILFGLVYYANSYANPGNNETKNSEKKHWKQRQMNSVVLVSFKVQHIPYVAITYL